MLHLKACQDMDLHSHQHYIRCVVDERGHSGDEYDREQPRDGSEQKDCLRFVICMSRAGSERLLRAQYIQSDIAFKRVVGFYEFEMASKDRDANTSTFSKPIIPNCTHPCYSC